MINFACDQCGKTFNVPDANAGKKGRCKQCGSVIQIPDAPAVATTQAPPRAATVAVAPAVATAQPVTLHPPVSPPPSQNVQVVLHQTEAKAANGLGVAGLIIGVVALCGCWIPVIGFIALPVALIGGLLSAVGFLVALTSKRSGTGWPIAGVSVNFTAVVIVFVVNLAMVGAAGKVGQAVREARRQAIEKQKAQAKVQVIQQEKSQPQQP